MKMQNIKSKKIGSIEGVKGGLRRRDKERRDQTWSQ